jgi:hypothetical protein
MKFVTVYRRVLQVQERHLELASAHSLGFAGVITADAIHELLFDPVEGDLPPLFPALMAARAVLEGNASQTLIWIDPAGTFYPPGAMRDIVVPGHLDILRPSAADLTWATVECMRCRHVGAVVSLMMHKPTRVEVRRLQLAAGQGGGVGVLLRPNLLNAGSNIHAAATRWLVSPAAGERTIQRWRIQQIHGHGRWTHSFFFLEKHRATGQTRFVHPSAPLVDHPLLSASS